MAHQEKKDSNLYISEEQSQACLPFGLNSECVTVKQSIILLYSGFVTYRGCKPFLKNHNHA